MPRTKDNDTLGERLRRRREEVGLTPQELAEEVQAPIKFVEGLERDEYDVFPAKVYGLGFLKKILVTLAAEDSDGIIKEFGNEWEVRMFRKQKELMPLPGTRKNFSVVTPARLWLGAGGILLLASLVFFGTRLTRFVGTPGLAIDEPPDSAAYSEPFISVKGKTEKESSLTVNGRELKIDGQGYFDETLELGSGVHSLEFLVKNRFGSERREVRNVFIK